MSLQSTSSAVVSLALAVTVLLLFSGNYVDAKEEYTLDLRMPSVVSEAEDSLICTGIQLEPEESYIVKFSPHVSRYTAHHLMVYGCTVPANSNEMWICNKSESMLSEHSVCAGGEERQILFAWALDAPAKALPPDVGFRVAGSTSVRHIVMQIHYARRFSDGETDKSGVTLHMTHKRPPQQMGYYVLANAGQVEPQKKEVHVETACSYDGEDTFYPIGYRTHSHSLGVVTAGYRIRDGVWTEIGRMSPQLPETFYNVTNPGMDIRRGDILAARCTMNSMTRHQTTIMGPTSQDEMCNFYIMYSTYNQDNLLTHLCFPATRDFKWSDGLGEYLPAPHNVSSLDGIPNADYVQRKFNMI